MHVSGTLLVLLFFSVEGLVALNGCPSGDYGCLSSELRNLSDDSTLELEGSYPINESFIIENIANVTILGKELDAVLFCHYSGGLVFVNITKLTIQNIQLLSCSVGYQKTSEIMLSRIHVLPSIPVISYSILIALCSDVVVDQVSVKNSTEVGLMVINVWGNAHISRTNFTGNSGGGMLLMSADSAINNSAGKIMQVSVTSCWFSNNENVKSGGGLTIMFYQAMFNVQVNVTDSQFLDNNATDGGGMYVVMYSSVAFSSVYLTGCSFISNTAVESGGGMFLNVGLESNQFCSHSAMSVDFTMTLSNSSFIQNRANDGGAIKVLFQKSFSFALFSVIAENNKGLKASAVSFHTDSMSLDKMEATFHDCIIQNNVSPNFPSALAAAIIANKARLILTSHNSISDTIGSGIKINEGEIHIQGTVIISGNQGINGGAMQLLGASQLVLYNNSILHLTNNRAIISGGGIFIDNCKGSCCFMRLSGQLNFHNCQFTDYFRTKLNFYGNQAHTGNSIFGPILNCSWIEDSIKNFYSSCQGKHFIAFDDSHNNYSTPGILQLSKRQFSIKPGGMLMIPIQSHDEFNQSVEDVLIYQIINRTSSIISSQAQVVNNMAPFIVAVSGAQNETVDVNITSSLSLSRLQVRVHLTNCGLGYWYNESTQACYCHKNFSILSIQCTLENITLPGGTWLGIDKAKDQLLWGLCPRQLCKSDPSVIIEGHSDEQCEFNRTGFLCSQCHDGFSVTLSSYRECRKCSNASVFLVIGMLLLGLIIGIGIVLCRVDISNGYVLSIIFQCNILSVYEIHLVPKDWYAIFIGIDIISLKLNLHACFYDGMTNMGAIMVQFSFVGYIIFLVGVACAVTSRMALPESHANIPTKAAPTIILMCQVALMELCTSGLSYVTVHSLDSDLIQHKWQASPDLAYIRSLHALPFSVSIISIIFLLLPTVLVLIYPPCPYRVALLAKLKPVYDVVWAPFRAKRHWWLIFRILVCWVVCICATFLSHTETSIFALCLILMILFFLQIWLKPFAIKWINTLDEAFLFVLLLMAIGRLYFLSTGDSYWLAYILTLTSCFYAIIILVVLIHVYTILPIILNDITSISQCLRVCVGKCCVRRRYDLTELDVQPLEVTSTEVSVAGLRDCPDLNDDNVIDTTGSPLSNVTTMGPVSTTARSVAAATLDSSLRISTEDESDLVDRSTDEEQFYTCNKVHGNTTL